MIVLESKQFTAHSDNMLSAEVSTLGIANPTHNTILFIDSKKYKFVKTDTDGEDVFGWRFQAEDGSKLLIIND